MVPGLLSERPIFNIFAPSMAKDDLIRMLQQLLTESQQRVRILEARAGQAESESKELRRQIRELQAQLGHVISLLEKSNETSEQLARELKLYSPKKCERITDGIKEEEKERSEGNMDTEPPGQNETSAADADAAAKGKSSRWEKAKARGNNHAKRKEYFCAEVCNHDIWPDSVKEEARKSAKVLRERTVIRYEYVPGKFIKHIYKLKICDLGGKAETPLAPPTPIFNSNFDSSFIAGILQLRYAYFLPVERIAKLFNECGFDVTKGTLNGLLSKAYSQIECLDEVMHKAVLGDSYINMDESYLTVLEQGPRSTDGLYSSKAYIWCAQARHLNLVHMFYDKGSRGKTVLTDYLPKDYHGAIQSDGLDNYKEVEMDTYPGTLHLTCWQHCKRDFLDIKDSADAATIVREMNKLYRKDHKIGEEWPPEKIIAYRQEYAPPIFEGIKQTIQEVLDKPTTLPKSALFKACNKVLNQFDTLCNYIKGAEYDLDNNAIERTMRTISMSRKSSLFAASHEGAKRSALFYSLACSCRLHNINTFEYFKDILDKVPLMPNSTTKADKCRELLPDKWRMDD